MHSNHDEARPLIGPEGDGGRNYLSGASDQSNAESYEIKFHDHGAESNQDNITNPRDWPRSKKLRNVTTIAAMAILSPLASSMFNPGITQIADDLGADEQSIIATTTGYVITMGIGPLVLAPCSETYGRRPLYITCFAIFALLQIPTALSPNAGFLIVMRIIAGFFGSVGIANGGGTISDMYDPSQRAAIFGWYLLGPVLGPALGPLLGGVIVTRLGWRWIYWTLTIICAINTAVSYFLLRETYAPVLLKQKKDAYLAQIGVTEQANADKYHFEGEDRRPLHVKLRHNLKRPLVIFAQPVIFTMSLYQAIIFGTMYSIHTNMQAIFQAPPYDFTSEQIGLLYLGQGLGFLTAVLCIIPYIDTVFNSLTARNKGISMPEFRLPLANIGSVLIPTSLFWFAWTVEYRLQFMIPVVATFFYGVGQLVVFNAVQNYYIDSFSKYAASAIAGGTIFRSVVGGVVPLFAPGLFNRLGYGWGVSIFAFASLAIAPSPLLFQYCGRYLREKYPVVA